MCLPTYIRHLIRQAQKQAEKERLKTLLIEGLESGDPIEVTDEWWEEKRTQLVDRLRNKQAE